MGGVFLYRITAFVTGEVTFLRFDFNWGEGRGFNVNFNIYKHCLNLYARTHVDVLEFLQALVKLTRVFVNYRTPKMGKMTCRYVLSESHSNEYIHHMVCVWSFLFSFSFFLGTPFVLGPPCLCAYSWQWQNGVVSVFLAWMILIAFLQKWPVTGVYILMFLNIIVTFLKVVFLALLLIIAFGDGIRRLNVFIECFDSLLIKLLQVCHYVVPKSLFTAEATCNHSCAES